MGDFSDRVRRGVRAVGRQFGAGWWPASAHRVPVRLQMTEVECGAACLAMVLSYHGRATRVAEVRDVCGVGRDGVTAKTIATAARGFGLRVRAFSLEPAAFAHAPLPAIVHWNFDHFVVVERWSSRAVEIVDPSAGRRRLTAEEFAASFTGVALTFEPGAQFAPRRAAPRSDRATWRGYLGYLLRLPGTPGLLAQILGASLVLQLFGLGLPAVTKVLVDQVLPAGASLGGANELLAILGVGIVFLVLAQAVVTYLRSLLVIYLQGRLDARLMVDFFEHVLGLPYRFFQARSSGDLLMRLESNTTIRETLTGQTVAAVLDGALVIGYLVIVLSLEPLFGALVVGLGLLQVVALVVSTPKLQDLSASDLATRAEAQSYLVEALRGIATLKASGAEDRALDQWSNRFFRNLNVSIQRSHFSALVELALGTLHHLSPLALLWFGASLVLSGAMSLGAMLALNALATACLSQLQSLAMSGQRLQLVGAHLERIADVAEAEPEQPVGGAGVGRVEATPVLTGRIELRHVDFRYDPNSPLVLRDISVTIEPGQKVALVGRTGSGKTTLAMLLLSLYQPTAGAILYDDQPVERLDYRSLRQQFGVVLQEPFLFSGSIRENIVFNDPTLPLAAAVTAARIACIDAEIDRLPMGYETRVAEGGAGLSGGQRQRLSLARAVAHRPAILLLDEATSHLDVMTEARVDAELTALDCTRIVIAHRLSTIRNADLILVLEDGAIVERGAHADLVARGGHYAALVHRQDEPSPVGD